MILEPWVLATPPAQVLLHDSMHHRFVTGIELKGDRKRDITLLVKGARVVAELHVIPVHGFPSADVGQQLRRLEDLGDEHRSLPFRSRR